VDGLFAGAIVASFGPNALDRSAEFPGLHRVSAARPAGLRSRLRQECPRRPGVYGMLTANGELIYVGKAKCLRTRLLSYFRVKSRDPKAGYIVRQANSIIWEHAPSEFAALLRELELIRRWRPRLNVHGQPNRRQRLYICLGRQPAPYVFLAPHPPPGRVAAFGPIPAGRRAREAVRHLNDWFQLRDCPRTQRLAFSDQSELFPIVRAAGCLRHEMRTCLGPCIAACTRDDYVQHVRAAQAFLSGIDKTLLEGLKSTMLEAASALSFERAALLRDKLDRLSWLQERLARLCQLRRRQSYVYPIAGYGGDDRWYFIHAGRVAGAIAAPRSDPQRRAAAALIRDIYKRKSIAATPVPSHEIDSVFMVAAWFRRHPEERRKTLRPTRAIAACGDASLPA
jgi:excinuclease ABC subunit C